MNYTTCLKLLDECAAINNASNGTFCSFNMAGCMTNLINYSDLFFFAVGWILGIASVFIMCRYLMRS